MHASLKTEEWQFYLSPGKAWEAMYEDCAQAKQRIIMEQYIFHNDEVGQKFLRLFIDKVTEGLYVHLTCDEVGSASFRNSPLVLEFREKGGHFYFYNSITMLDLLKPRDIFPRTHLKALAIDASIIYIGGVCIAERMRDWRDTQMRLTGGVLPEKVSAILDHNPINRTQSADVKEIILDDFSYIQSSPSFFRHPIYQTLLDAIREAETSIYISAAFFVPTRRLRRYLKKAAKRGVKVVILIPEHSDFWIADWACLSYAVKLLKNKIRIFRYGPNVLHTKTVVIDGHWGTVGSCNMDPLSFFHNREANLVIKNTEALKEMEKDFLEDLEKSRELTLAFYKKIPLWKRIAAHFARIARPIL